MTSCLVTSLRVATVIALLMAFGIAASNGDRALTLVCALALIITGDAWLNGSGEAKELKKANISLKKQNYELTRTIDVIRDKMRARG